MRASRSSSAAVWPGPTPPGSAVASPRREPARSPKLLFLYLLWFIVLFDAQWLAAQVVPPIRQLPTALFGLFLPVLFTKRPTDWVKPMAALLIYAALMLPFAWNRIYALVPTKQLTLYYVLVLGTMSFVRTAKQATPILAMFFMWQYLWWVGLGAKAGLVGWHPAYANYDGYGPLMVLGMPLAVSFGLAVKSRKLKWLAFATAGGCVIGLVSSFARGAVVSGVLVVAWTWYRSRRKGPMTLALLGAAAVLVVATNVFFQGARRGEASGNFWTEMASITQQDDATKEDRQILWDIAVMEFKSHPVFGVGANNFGPYAADHFEVGEVGGAYEENPRRLYDRAIHSTYFQILCEFGLTGTLILLWMLWDFYRRNRQLRSAPYDAAFRSRSDGALKLHQLALGLEAAMVGYLGTSVFYNQIFGVHWLFTLLAVNLLLHRLAKP